MRTAARIAFDKSEFRREQRKAYDIAYNARNPKKKLEMQQAYQKAKPEKWRAYHKKHNALPTSVDYHKNWRLKTSYGITLDDYHALVAAQNGKCKICGITPKLLHVDHEHQSGRVRGLLCSPCNTAIGLLKENINTLQSAQEYIRGNLG